MTNLSLQDRFSLISLNALNSTRNSTAKKQQFAVSLLPVYWIDSTGNRRAHRRL